MSFLKKKSLKNDLYFANENVAACCHVRFDLCSLHTLLIVIFLSYPQNVICNDRIVKPDMATGLPKLARLFRRGCWRQTFFLWEEAPARGPPAWGRRSSAAPGHWATWGLGVDQGFLRNIVDLSSERPDCRSRDPWERWWSGSGVVPPFWALPDHDVLKKRLKLWEIWNK